MPDRHRLVVVDDEPELRAMVAEYLGRYGYDVATAADSREMDTCLADATPDLLILDVNMPGESGFAIARRIRARSEVPILMLTAADDVVDRVVGLELGADDYVTKPFDLRELRARIQAVLRRNARQSLPASRPEASSTALVQFGDLRLDIDARRLLQPDGVQLELTAMEFDLLVAFARNPNRVLSRERLLDIAHNRDTEPFDRSIDVRIARIRRKVERDPTKPQLIKTMRGAGYMFRTRAELMPSGEANFEGISEGQLRAVFDSIPTRIALLDRNRRYRYVNREYIEFAGLPAARIIGRTIPEVLAEEAFAPFYPQGERALAGEIVPWEGWLEYRQGRRYVQRISVPLRDADGAVDGYFIFNRDLTELKQSEQALAEQLAARTASEALNTAIIASALDCVIAIDEAGEVVEFNPAAEQTFGHRRADVLGRKIGELIVPPDLRQRHAEGFARYLAGGVSHIIGRRIEIEAVRANGENFPVELTITEVRLPERRLFTAHLRDLTAARAAEAEIQRQREALHQSEKMAAFGSLLAGVAHELNNPLSIVIGNALMLSEAAETSAPELADRAQRVQAAAERCGRIVRSFLAMARQRETQQRLVALHELVDAAMQLLAYGLRSSGIVVEQDIPHDLPKLFCDPDQMQQVLINLLVNARQALEEQPQPRRVRIEAGADAATMELSVSDSGPGIAEAIRARIFDPFFTTKPIGAGTGIGLGVSRGIVEAHGGTLTLAPTDSGARFVVRLPLREINHVTAPAAPDPVVSRDGKSVLIIDDEAEVGRLLSEMLSAQAFRCDVVGSGATARALLEQRDYDAILCDVRMPEVDGPALFAWLSEHRPHLSARMAFVTGDTLGAAAGGFLARAGRPILEKPFVPAELRRLMAELVPDPG